MSVHFRFSSSRQRLTDPYFCCVWYDVSCMVSRTCKSVGYELPIDSHHVASSIYQLTAALPLLTPSRINTMRLLVRYFAPKPAFVPNSCCRLRMSVRILPKQSVSFRRDWNVILCFSLLLFCIVDRIDMGALAFVLVLHRAHHIFFARKECRWNESIFAISSVSLPLIHSCPSLSFSHSFAWPHCVYMCNWWVLYDRLAFALVSCPLFHVAAVFVARMFLSFLFFPFMRDSEHRHPFLSLHVRTKKV